MEVSSQIDSEATFSLFIKFFKQNKPTKSFRMTAILLIMTFKNAFIAITYVS